MREEIDVLLVYVPAIDQVCWFGPEIFHNKTNIYIRIAPAKNGQKASCILAEEHVW